MIRITSISFSIHNSKQIVSHFVYLQSKLSSYRELQKAGKELNGDQKVAVAKYDEVAQTLEFARDLSKHVGTIALSAEREAKKQAKRVSFIIKLIFPHIVSRYSFTITI